MSQHIKGVDDDPAVDCDNAEETCALAANSKNSANSEMKYLAEKYYKIKDRLPEEVVAIFDKMNARPGEKRTGKNEFLHELFERDQQGNWVVNYNKPYFRQQKERYRRAVLYLTCCWALVK